MTRCTTGEWILDGDVIYARVVDGGVVSEPLLAHLNPSMPDVAPIEDAAVRRGNGLLFAHARHLLEACHYALEWIERDETTHGRLFDTGNVLRAAIAKAEGRA